MHRSGNYRSQKHAFNFASAKLLLCATRVLPNFSTRRLDEILGRSPRFAAQSGGPCQNGLCKVFGNGNYPRQEGGRWSLGEPSPIGLAQVLSLAGWAKGEPSLLGFAFELASESSHFFPSKDEAMANDGIFDAIQFFMRKVFEKAYE